MSVYPLDWSCRLASAISVGEAAGLAGIAAEASATPTPNAMASASVSLLQRAKTASCSHAFNTAGNLPGPIQGCD